VAVPCKLPVTDDFPAQRSKNVRCIVVWIHLDENVERVAASVHADAVLATRLVSMDMGHGQGNSNDTRGDSVYKATDLPTAHTACR
jgi:hypothetical protein